MKRITILAFGLLMMLQVQAQNNGMVALYPLVSDANTEQFTEEAQTRLKGKLSDILMSNGAVSSEYLGQFAIAAFAYPREKSLLTGLSTQILEKIEVDLYITDFNGKTILSSTTLESKGSGANEERSFVSAIGKIKTSSEQLTAFMQEGISQIVAHYDSKADNILNEARTLSKSKKYDQALCLVTVIPAQCKKYNEAKTLTLDLFKQYSLNCNDNLSNARKAWEASKDSVGADAAAQYLALIYPDATCYADAVKLYNEIKTKVQDWTFEMNKWQEGVDMEAQRLSAARSIGAAFGKSQQPDNININYLRVPATTPEQSQEQAQQPKQQTQQPAK